jgi:pyrroloquinoline quinone biosynthesis protein E
MTAPRPFTLIAELTYRCPLTCAYCYNPIELAAAGNELTTDEWACALAQAEALGVVQVHFTGGEPLLRPDLEELVEQADRLGLYPSLITSGTRLERERVQALADAGLMHLQLALHDVDPRAADDPLINHKRLIAHAVHQAGLALTVNVVLHRQNLDRAEDLVDLAESLEPSRLELATVQLHGWALLNRQALLPTSAQIEKLRSLVTRARERLAGRAEVASVLPDYHAGRPKACMGGWGQSTIVVAPDGRALPCHNAHTLPGFEWPTLRQRALADLWNDSPGFNRFRGEAWMSEPCRSCPERVADHGGCRCQAFALLGDASLTDPACALSPGHQVVQAVRSAAEDGLVSPELVRRAPPR